jgi:hypothetical protein
MFIPNVYIEEGTSMSKPKLLKVRHMSRPKAFYLGPPIFLFETGIFACAWLPHKCPTKKKM